MKTSIKTVYAIKALYEVALHPSIGELKTSEIARAQEIPVKFLEQILASLKKAGLVASTRGRVGGYALARTSKEISLFDVVKAIEGPIVFSRSARKGSAVYEALKKLEDGVTASLKGITLESIVEEKRKKDNTYIYSI